MHRSGELASVDIVSSLLFHFSPLTLITETPSVIDSSWVIYTHVRDAVQKRKVDSIVLLVPSAPRRSLSLLGLSSTTSAVISIYGEDAPVESLQPSSLQQHSQRSTTSISLSPSTPRAAFIHVKIVDLSHPSFTSLGGFGESKLIEALQPPSFLKTSGGSHLIAIEDLGPLIEYSESLAAASNLIRRIQQIAARNGPSTAVSSTTNIVATSTTTTTTQPVSNVPTSSSSPPSSSPSAISSSPKQHVTVHITALCNPDADWAQSNNHGFSRKFGLGIFESLALQAHYIIRVGPLPSGYSRDVHGRVSVEENTAVTSALYPSAGGSASSRPSYLGGSRSVLFRLSSDGKARAVGDVQFSSLQQQIGNATKSSRNSTNSTTTTFKEVPLSQDQFGEALVDD